MINKILITIIFFITTNSIKATEAVNMSNNIRQISIAPIIGEAIRRVHMEQSVSSLFE